MKTSSSDLARYDERSRLNHWAAVLLFFSAAASGLAFFHPSLFFLSNLFGGGAWTRILHPYLGLLVFLSFLGMFAKLWRDNILTPADHEWLSKAGAMFNGDKHAMPEADRYNGGQKVVFWTLGGGLLVLVCTGLVFWHAWFPNLPILARRVAVLLHAASAVVILLAVVVHAYAAFWVKGTIRAMTRGTVTQGWARANHPLWYRRVRSGGQ